MATEIKLGWFLELIPREPPPAMDGLTLVGHVVLNDPPIFGLDIGGGVGQLFRVDQHGEICVREVDRHVFEIGRICPSFAQGVSWPVNVQ